MSKATAAVGTVSIMRKIMVDFNGLMDGVVGAVETFPVAVGERVLAAETGYSCEGIVTECRADLPHDKVWRFFVEIAVDMSTWKEDE